MSFAAKEIRVLQAIYHLDSPTRSHIARDAGLSTVSVTSVLNKLVQEKAVAKMGKTRSATGRPSALYRLDPSFGCSIGVSLRTGDFRIVAVDSTGRIIEDREFILKLSSSPEDHLGDIINQVSFELERFLCSERVSRQRVLCLGITPPGMVDTDRGMWLHGLQVSGISHIDLGRILEEKLHIPALVEDQARCLGLLEGTRAERRHGQPLLFLYLGTGVGAGILVDGKLYRGCHGLAGEVGHLIVEEEGDRCSCGNIGCLETVVSESSIIKRFTRRLEEGVISSLQRFNGPTGKVLTLDIILEAARAEDRLARSTLFEIGLFIGEACAKLIKLYNPRTLIIGGPAGVFVDFFKEPIVMRINQRVIPEMLIDFTLDFVPYERHDEAAGAALAAERTYWSRMGQRASAAARSTTRGSA